MSYVRRLACCAGACIAAGLGAQASVENRVADDGRSGTVMLRFQDLRRFAFIAGEGVAQVRTRPSRCESQIAVATTPEGGDQLYAEWQPGEVGSLLDLGSLSAPAGGTLFERVTVNEARQRFESRNGVLKRAAVRPGHVYVLAIDGPTSAERFVLPGDALFVKLLVTGYQPGVQVTLRWEILNEPFAVAGGAIDLRKLPRLEWAGDTSDDERQESERLLAQVVKGVNVDTAVKGLVKLGHKMLPAAANLLCSCDPATAPGADAIWAIDNALSAVVLGRGLAERKAAPARTAAEQLSMVRFWCGFARRTRTEKDWLTAIHQQPHPLPARDPHR
jgi:hypothetical protein